MGRAALYASTGARVADPQRLAGTVLSPSPVSQSPAAGRCTTARLREIPGENRCSWNYGLLSLRESGLRFRNSVAVSLWGSHVMPAGRSISRWWIFGCLVCFETVKEVATFCLGPAPIAMDAAQYFEFGQSVARGDFFLLEQSVSYRMPGYGWFLGAFLVLFGRYALLAAIVTQHLLVMATSLVSAAMTYRATGRFSAFLAAYALSAVGVSRAWFANTLLADTLFTFCLSLVFWGWYEYLQQPSSRGAWRLGLALCAALLVRPVPQLLWVPIGATMIGAFWMRHGQLPLSTVLRHAAIVGGLLAICVSPWCFRNRVLFGEFFVAKLPAVNKWLVCFQDGSSPNLPLPAHASADRLVSILQSRNYDMSDRYCYSVIGCLEDCGLSEREIHSLVDEVCRAAIAEHPLRFSFSALKRSVNIWRCLRNAHPAWGDGEPAYFAGQVTWRSEAIAAIYEPVLRNAFSRSLRLNELALLAVALGTWWLIRDVRLRMFGIALALGFLYFTCVTAAVETENYRYRMILEPVMVVAVVSGFTARFGGRATCASELGATAKTSNACPAVYRPGST